MPSVGFKPTTRVRATKTHDFDRAVAVISCNLSFKTHSLLYAPPALTTSDSLFCSEWIYRFHMILVINIIYVNSINQLIFFMEKFCVFFEVQAEFLNDTVT
jgi:hypothetical protein